ncbi:TetR/AcrR family transcriptional regulator [Nocardia blacklockiae]|uniref:TetR/AcrR family transcriptional regulator n=1 Tax=Nocardia blacklockiae TaxID=480036 RepID=UPI001894E6EE|nr:TetR/AcrR family transcriptional regulator [Nocardia blacklockiae]MBF6172639.1 TetR family transcriptional regulator C-terminal domain-containing protein [Nocardia blacklockiae]
MGARQAAPTAEATDRRRALLDRLAEVIAEDGIEGVSIRTLAARAGVSIGTVQYYFSTKNDLLLKVWEHVRDEATRRFLESGVADLPPLDRLHRLTDLLIAPAADDILARVWLALAARAAHDPEIAALHRGQWQRTEDILARALAAVHPARADENPDAAAELLALLDGLTIAILTEPDRMPTARATRIARRWTDAWAADR